MILGINTAKSAIYLAECQISESQFSVTKISKLTFTISGPSDLSQLLQTLATVMTGSAGHQPSTVAILKCVSGLRPSSIEAVKAEALVQLAAHDKKISVHEVEPRSLSKIFKCRGSDEKWPAASRELIDPKHSLKYWIEGGSGAVAAAYSYSISLT